MKHEAALNISKAIAPLKQSQSLHAPLSLAQQQDQEKFHKGGGGAWKLC